MTHDYQVTCPMKYCAGFFFAALLLSSSAQALQHKVEIYEQFDKLKVIAFVGIQAIEESPEWDPNLMPPPLTVGAAIQAVKDYLPSSDTLGPVTEIEIRPVPKHQKKWHYLIKVANDAMQSKYDIYVVLMNGMVTPAIIEPQGYK